MSESYALSEGSPKAIDLADHDFTLRRGASASPTCTATHCPQRACQRITAVNAAGRPVSAVNVSEPLEIIIPFKLGAVMAVEPLAVVCLVEMTLSIVHCTTY